MSQFAFSEAISEGSLLIYSAIDVHRDPWTFTYKITKRNGWENVITCSNQIELTGELAPNTVNTRLYEVQNHGKNVSNWKSNNYYPIRHLTANQPIQPT